MAAVDAAVPAAPAGDAPVQPQPMLPPCNEPGFPALPMFGGEVGEWLNSLVPQTMLMVQSSPRDGVMTSALGMFSGESAHKQVGTQVITSRGAVKAEMMANGMLQTAFEGFSPLPFLQFNTQLAFVPQGFAGGVLQGMAITPVGMLMAVVNTAGQMSSELLTAVQPTPTSQLMLGVHAYGLPGLLCGVKTCCEWQHHQLDGDDLVGGTTLSFACTSPFVSAGGAPLTAPKRSVSLSVLHRTSAKNAIVAALEFPAEADGQMTVGGTRQLSEHTRLRGKWGTSGVLALALEVAAEKSSATLVAEMNARPGESLAPKFGATVTLQP